MRGQTHSGTPDSQPGRAKGNVASDQPKMANATSSIPPQVTQAAADDLHQEAAAAIPKDSKLAQTMASSDISQAAAEPSEDTKEYDQEASDEQTESGDGEADSADIASSKVTDGRNGKGTGRQTRSPDAAKGFAAASASRQASAGITVVRSNPRFASKPVKEEQYAAQHGIKVEDTSPVTKIEDISFNVEGNT